MEVFTTPNSKNIIATLPIVTIEKSELTFLLILYFYGYDNDFIATDEQATNAANKFRNHSSIIIIKNKTKMIKVFPLVPQLTMMF